MKAFLLAAGTGTRLRPITDTTPKCLVTIGDRTLLDIWLDAFARAGVTEVLINLNHLADAVRAHVATRAGQQPAIRLVFEPELLGSAGTLAAGRDWVEEEEFFLACNADNLTDFDLDDLIAAHRAAQPARHHGGLPVGEPVGRRRGGRWTNPAGSSSSPRSPPSRPPTW